MGENLLSRNQRERAAEEHAVGQGSALFFSKDPRDGPCPGQILGCRVAPLEGDEEPIEPRAIA